MSWHKQKAVERIFNTFKRLKNQVWEQDIEALKLLNTDAIRQSEGYIKDNLLYGKLLCVILKLNLEYYGDMKTSIKATNNILKTSLTEHIAVLQMTLNNKEFENYLKSLGVDFEKYNNEKTIIKENQKEMAEKIKKSWTFETVERSFFNTANDFLKETENYI